MSDTTNRILAGLDENTREKLTRKLPSAEEAMNMVFMDRQPLPPAESANGPAPENVIQQIAVEDILNHPKQAYKVKYEYDELNQKVDEFIESVAEHGIITPLILTSTYGDMELDGKYILVAGQKRLYAAKQLGLETVPAIVSAMSEEEADIKMQETNTQREIVLPSEKAKGYSVKYAALQKKRAGRPKKNFAPLEQNFNAIEKMAENETESRANIQRFMRLNSLIPEWLTAVDNKAMGYIPAISLRAGVALSYLSEKEQKDIYDVAAIHNVKELPLELAELFKNNAGSVDTDFADKVISEAVYREKDKPTIKLKFFSKSLMRKTDEFFPDDDIYKQPEVREQTIIEALDMFFKAKAKKKAR